MTQPEFRLRPIKQICWVVESIEEAIPWFVKTMGAGPFFLLPHIPLRNVRFRGQPSTLDQSSAIGQWGALQVELFEQHCDSPAGCREYLGPGQAQHLTWEVDDLEVEKARLGTLGFSPVLEATCDIPGGSFEGGWFDGKSRFGALLEVYESNEVLDQVYAKVAAAAEGWDGTNPLRSIEDLFPELAGAA